MLIQQRVMDAITIIDEIDRSLSRGEQYLWSFLSNNGENSSIMPVLRCSFSLIPTEKSALVKTVFDPHSAAMQSSAKHSEQYIDFALGVSQKALKELIPAYLASIACESELIYDTPVDQSEERQKERCSSVHGSAKSNILIGTSLAAKLPPAANALVLMALPASNVLWNARRSFLMAALGAKNKSTLVDDDGDSDKASVDGTLVHLCLKDLLLTDLLLSCHVKLQEAWVYRLWLISFLQKSRLIAPFGCERGIIDTNAFRLHDNSTFFFAAEHHCMNYNAWQYRRGIFTLLCYGNLVTMQQEPPLYFDEESTLVLQYLRTHNADGSAISYCMFVLKQQQRLDKARVLATVTVPQYCEIGRTTGRFARKAIEENIQSIVGYAEDIKAAKCYSVHLWKQLFLFTQQQIRLHAERGHECMWHLRLGLIQWALFAHSALPCSWTIQDELEWVSCFTDSPVCTKEVDSALLEPNSIGSALWTENSGLLAWTSYLACRYGRQLITLLSTPRESM